MQGTSNVAAEKTGPAKLSEKLAEKRRALGRGLESLLPGPRVVLASPTLPQSARKDGATAEFASGRPGAAVATQAAEGGRAGTPVASLQAETVLDQLQAVASGRTADGETVFLVEIGLIDPNPYQTRREFNEQALAELRDSIAAQGVLQPIVVRPRVEGRFILILGERRLRASRMAGKTTIPVIVRRVSEQQAAEMTLVENLQRQDLNCVEQAEAFANLSTEFKLTQEQIGARAGISRESVSNYMRLLTLPEGVIGALQKGRLTYSHARTLLRLTDNVQIWKYAQRAMEEKMSVAKLEEVVFGVSAPTDRGEQNKGTGARWVDPNVKAAQRSLEEVLGMRVRIRDRKGRGKIVIEYGTLEDFGRVVGMLKGK
jgi:ParB family chromosome partitioning protein